MKNNIKTISANIFKNGRTLHAEISFAENITNVNIIGEYKSNLPYLVPGFIDLHVHGGGGHDFMEGTSKVETILKTHVKFGTTSMLATTMTAPFEELKKAFMAIAPLYKNRPRNASRILGIHLEGPFISPQKLGAQPDFTRQGTLDEIKELNQIVPIKIITLAPEIFNHLELITELNKLNIVVQIGHTNGTYEEGVIALNQGAKSFTHLFNAMSSFHHRSPGMTGAALAHAQYAELIPDLLHVHPGAIRMALRAIPNLYFVTDATAATGMPDGDYKLGSHIVHKCLGGVRLKDGTLAGSALTMDQAFRNIQAIGLTSEDCCNRFSTIPAGLIAESQLGAVSVGYMADFVLMNAEFKVIDVFIEGDVCDH